MKPRIHLIGGGGSGKSYAARKLSAELDVPAYELDDLFWDRSARGYGVRSEPGGRDRELAAIVERDGWIIEGVYYGWLAPSFAAADIIIALTPSIAIRQWRVIKRYVRRKIERDAVRSGSLADLWRLLRWNQSYDAQHLSQARIAIAALGRTWVECKTFDDVSAATRHLARD